MLDRAYFAFRNRLAILRSIDKHELEQAGIALEPGEWERFRDNPERFLLCLGDRRARPLWALIEERQGKPDLQPGDIVQCVENHHWAGALLIVDEVRSWGCVAYLRIPRNDGTGGDAPIRLAHGEFEAVGAAAPLARDKTPARAEA